MFGRKSQGQGSGGRHAAGAPLGGTPAPRPPAAGPAADFPSHVEHRTTRGRTVRFADLQVDVKDGTVYDTAGPRRALGPLTGARAHVTVLEADLAKANVASRALGRKQASMISHVEITVTVAGTALTRAADASGARAGTGLIRRARKQAAEFNDLARRWPDPQPGG